MNRIALRLASRLRLFWTILGLGTWAAAASLSTASEVAYIVKRGDTLWSIAKKNGISVSELAEKNGISRNQYVITGQRLTLPAKSKNSASAPAATSGSASTLSVGVQSAIDKARVRSGRWRYIVIHHSGVDSGTVKGMDRYHREERHMENGLAYHFVVGNGKGMRDGEVVAASRWIRQLNGGHLISEKQNTYSLGICLVGNFDKRKPSPRQMQQLTALVRALMKRCQIPASAVRTHQQINVVHTRCPGRYFPAKSFLESLKAPGRK